MNNLLTLATGGASLLAGGSNMHEYLEQSVPGWRNFQNFFQQWLRIDITSLFVAATLLGHASTGFQSIQGVMSKFYWAFLRFMTASVSIAGEDRLNKEVLNWLGANVLSRQGSRILTAHSETIQSDAWHFRRVQERDDFRHEKRRPVQFLPTFGTTWFFHERRFFMIRRIMTNRSAIQRSSSFSSAIPDEYAGAPLGSEPLVIMCVCFSTEPVKRFLQTCRDFADKQRESYVTVRMHRNTFGHEDWDVTILRAIRPLETIHFDETTKAELLVDIANYLDPQTRLFYFTRGVPYHRGYLLHGPPGTGKTSLALALAGHFGLELYLLHIPSLRDDDSLERRFTALPPRCIILLEDIDAVGIPKRKAGLSSKSDDKDSKNEDGDSDEDDEEKDGERYGACRVTLSGLLNVLDGVASQEGRIVCLTSNHADRLDEALTRPGRIDKIIFLGPISQESARLMFLRMYASDTADQSSVLSPVLMHGTSEKLEQLAQEFADNLPDLAVTPAELQGFLLHHRHDPAMARTKVADWAAATIENKKNVEARIKHMAQVKRRKRREKQRRMMEDIGQQTLGFKNGGSELDFLMLDKAMEARRAEIKKVMASGKPAAGEVQGDGKRGEKEVGEDTLGQLEITKDDEGIDDATKSNGKNGLESTPDRAAGENGPTASVTAKELGTE